MAFNFNNILNKINNITNGNFRLSGINRVKLIYNVIKEEQISEFLEENSYILDVRTRQEFMTMRIEKAVNIPISEISWNISTLIPDKRNKILVYCFNGERTKEAIIKLNKIGYNNIYVWEGAGLNSLKEGKYIKY